MLLQNIFHLKLPSITFAKISSICLSQRRLNLSQVCTNSSPFIVPTSISPSVKRGVCFSSSSYHINKPHLNHRPLCSMNSYYAEVNIKGVLQLIEPEFTLLLQSEWPTWRGPHLPDELVAGIKSRSACFVGNTIAIRFFGLNGQFLLHCRKKSLIDTLSQRELEVANQLAHGASHKKYRRRTYHCPAHCPQPYCQHPRQAGQQQGYAGGGNAPESGNTLNKVQSQRIIMRGNTSAPAHYEKPVRLPVTFCAFASIAAPLWIIR